MDRNEARKPHKCPHCERRFTPREMRIDDAFDDHLREKHSDVIIMPPENFFYLNEAEKER